MSTKKILNFLLMCFGTMAIVYVTASIVSGDFNMKFWTDEVRQMVGVIIYMCIFISGVIIFLGNNE